MKPTTVATRRLPAALLVCVLAVALSGCDRRPRFVSESADTTATAAPDTFADAVAAAHNAWDGGGAGDGSAAAATARLLVDDFRAHTDAPLASRSRRFLDSLGFGAEIGGRGQAVIVNFFAVADPNGGSWPYLFWRDRDQVRSQPVEGSGMRLADVALQVAADSGATQVAALFSRSAASGQQPLVFVWRRAPKATTWSFFQTLGPDSLGGVGTARFVDSGADSVALETRTWSRTPGFDECPSCPHVFRTRRFRWNADGFSTVSVESEDTPYVAFVRFVTALSVPDYELAREVATDPAVVDAARALGMGERRGVWRVAPGIEEPGADMTFFRGARDAYRVRFVRQWGGWRVAGVETASRLIE